MDWTVFSHPGFVLSLISALVVLISWFIRLEAKIQANANAIARGEHDFKQLQHEFEQHRLSQDIHFNQRISQQVEAGNERRFSTIENQLTQINHKLDKLAERK